jgi:hypothetical protein
MNFQLGICQVGHVVVDFIDISPDLSTDDFIAYLVHRLRLTLRGSDRTRLEQIVSRTVMMITDDGTLRRLLSGPPPGTKPQGKSVNDFRSAFPTCGEAFDVLDDGTKLGLRGWVFFAYNEQSVECVVRFRNRLGGRPNASHSKTPQKMIQVKAVDLLFGDVLDVKESLVQKLGIGSHAELAVLEGGREGDFVELEDSALLFPMLRQTGEARLLVVQREGITVSVLIGGRRYLIPRFDIFDAEVRDVHERMRGAFGIELAGGLFLEGYEEEGQLQACEQLHKLLGPGGEVRLVGYVDPPHHIAKGVTVPHCPNTFDNFDRDARLVKVVAFQSPTKEPKRVSNPVGNDFVGLTCRMDLTGWGRGTVDIRVPCDGLPFLGSDLKEFLLTNKLLPLDASIASLVLFNGRRELWDEEDVLQLLPEHERVQLGIKSATILLNARRRHTKCS